MEAKERPRLTGQRARVEQRFAGLPVGEEVTIVEDGGGDLVYVRRAVGAGVWLAALDCLTIVLPAKAGA